MQTNQDTAAVALSPVDQDTKAAFDRLRATLDACGPKKDARAIAGIAACIAEGMNTRARIVGALRELNLDYRHVNIVLNTSTADDPARGLWKRDAEGIYTLHSQTLSAAHIKL